MDSITVKSIVIMIIVIAIYFGFQYYQKKKKDDVYKRMASLLDKGDFDEFDRLASSKEVARMFPPFNIFFIKLNAAMMKGSHNAVDKALKDFDQLRMSKPQKQALYEKTFYYYLGQQDEKGAKKYLDLLTELDVNNIDVISCFYDTYLQEGSRYLDRMLEILEDTPLEQKPAYEALISDIYKNRKDKENAVKYEELAKKHFEDVYGTSADDLGEIRKEAPKKEEVL